MNWAVDRRLVYVMALVLALLLWLTAGDFDAVEAPYVGF